MVPPRNTSGDFLQLKTEVLTKDENDIVNVIHGISKIER